MTITETERLIIREFQLEDAAFILELLNSPGWLQFIGDRGINNLESAQDYIITKLRANYRLQGFGFYCVIQKSDHLPVGMVGLIKRESLENVDIGFAFLPAHERKGYGFESASAIMHHARTAFNIERLVAITNADNVKSQNLLKKLGLQFEKMILLPDEDKEIMLFGTP